MLILDTSHDSDVDLPMSGDTQKAVSLVAEISLHTPIDRCPGCAGHHAQSPERSVRCVHVVFGLVTAGDNSVTGDPGLSPQTVNKYTVLNTATGVAASSGL